MFKPKAVRAAFEEALGVRLDEHHGSPDLDAKLRAMGAPPFPRVAVYESPTGAENRFGGAVSVSVDLDGHWLGTLSRVRDEGLQIWPPETRNSGWNVWGQARRANVSVGLIADGREITPQQEATWSFLISCLRGL